MSKRDYNYSPATIELMRAGVTVTAVAEEAGVSPTAVSRKLKGELGGPQAIADHLVALAGSEVYERILELVGDTEGLEDAVAEVEVDPTA